MTFKIIWKNYDLGLIPESVSLAPPSAQWAKAFDIFSSIFNEHFSDLKIILEHIGSTSLASHDLSAIKSKPILDILGICENLQLIDNARERFESEGFTWKGENQISNRRYLTFKSWRGPETFIHLNIFEKSSPEVEKHLLFRDYLIAHPLVAHAYQDQKMRLQSLYEYKRETYSETKSSMIHDILAKARFWKEKNNT